MAALILYGSFYPWHFRSVALPANPLWILLHSWPDTFDRFFYRDAVVNLTLYAPFGVFCFLALGETRSRAGRAVATVVAAALLSSSVEMTQLLDAGRVCSLFDVLCNALGAAAGVVIAASFPRAISGAVSEAEAIGILRLSGVAGLLYLFAGYQLFPFFPALSLYTLRAKLAVLSGPGMWMTRDFFESLSGWLAASALLETLAGSEASLWMVALALLLIPLKLLIAQRTMTGSELLGALLGVACWMLFRSLSRKHLAAAAVALGGLTAAGLLPLRFNGFSQAFSWIPFLAMLESPWETALLTLLGKSFLYGSAVWLLRSAGRGWLASVLLVSAALAAVEAMQIWLPGRTPESTDPLLAVLLGCGLMLMERHALVSPPARSAL